MAANNCIECDVAIVGSGFAGSLIANELSEKGIKVVILEAGPGVPPNINDYMNRFYKARRRCRRAPFRRRCLAIPASWPPAGRRTTMLGASLAGSHAKLSRSEGTAALLQHLRTARRRHVALARHLAAGSCPRFHDEVQLREEPAGLPVPGLAKGHPLPEAEPVLRQGGGGIRRFRRCGGAELSQHRFSK